MKSDHPVLDSRYLLWEAAQVSSLSFDFDLERQFDRWELTVDVDAFLLSSSQSHIYGLNWTLAMDSVFSAPAKAMGMDHRIGHVVAGHDADGQS